MRAVLHVGQSKAGSTALQDCLLRSRDILLERGVLYPANADGVAFNNHRLLMQPLVEFSALTGDVRRHADSPEHLAAMHAEFLRAVRDQIRDTAPDCLVLSHENLFRDFPADRRARLRSDLDGMGVETADIVIYIRRPSARYLSGVQQGLKARGVFPAPARVEYQRRLSCYMDMFGKESVHPILFERSLLRGGSITHDFAARFLSDAGVAPDALRPSQRTNESVSAASLMLLDRFRREIAAGGSHEFTLKDLRVNLVRSERGLSLSRPRLKQDVAEMIDYSTTEPLWLRDTWGLEFPDFDYQGLASGRTLDVRRIQTLEELIEDFGAEDLDRLVERLTTTLPEAPVTAWVRTVAAERPATAAR